MGKGGRRGGGGGGGVCQEEGVDGDVEREGGELVARVGVVPQEDLHGDDGRRVEKDSAAEEEDPCAA